MVKMNRFIEMSRFPTAKVRKKKGKMKLSFILFWIRESKPEGQSYGYVTFLVTKGGGDGRLRLSKCSIMLACILPSGSSLDEVKREDV